jgi:hypothetical protein
VQHRRLPHPIRQPYLEDITDTGLKGGPWHGSIENEAAAGVTLLEFPLGFTNLQVDWNHGASGIGLRGFVGSRVCGTPTPVRLVHGRVRFTVFAVRIASHRHLPVHMDDRRHGERFFAIRARRSSAATKITLHAREQ